MTDFARLKIIPKLADYFHPDRGDPIPHDILGARIVSFGTADSQRSLPGAGLIIDYVPAGARQIKRLVLAANDVAMEVKFCEAIPAS